MKNHRTLNERDKAIPTPDPLGKDVQIVAEISERLIEWAGMSWRDRQRVLQWLATLHRVYLRSESAMWLYLDIQSGCCDSVSLSYEELSAGNESRQAVHQQRQRDIETLSQMFPNMQKVLTKLKSTSCVGENKSQQEKSKVFLDVTP
jgi:hypothetical protein